MTKRVLIERFRCRKTERVGQRDFLGRIESPLQDSGGSARPQRMSSALCAHERCSAAAQTLGFTTEAFEN